jgi:hypothetical protein
MTTSVIDVCGDCIMEHAENFVAELGGPSDRDEDDFHDEEI